MDFKDTYSSTEFSKTRAPIKTPHSSQSVNMAVSLVYSLP